MEHCLKTGQVVSKVDTSSVENQPREQEQTETMMVWKAKKKKG